MPSSHANPALRPPSYHGPFRGGKRQQPHRSPQEPPGRSCKHESAVVASWVRPGWAASVAEAGQEEMGQSARSRWMLLARNWTCRQCPTLPSLHRSMGPGQREAGPPALAALDTAGRTCGRFASPCRLPLPLQGAQGTPGAGTGLPPSSLMPQQKPSPPAPTWRTKLPSHGWGLGGRPRTPKCSVPACSAPRVGTHFHAAYADL